MNFKDIAAGVAVVAVMAGVAAAAVESIPAMATVAAVGSVATVIRFLLRNDSGGSAPLDRARKPLMKAPQTRVEVPELV